MKRLFFSLLIPTALAAAPLLAAERVDDTGTRTQDPTVRLRWENVVPRRGDSPTAAAVTVVYVRLNLSPWRGQNGRLYLAFPDRAGTPVDAEWTTQGRLLPGRVRSGERALVYSGRIEGAVLEDTWRLTLRTDGRRLVRPELLEFTFEMEATAP